MADILATRPGGKRVAIVGSGIAGNVAAYLLRRQHDVTVFEANDYVGGHTNTVDVPLDESGKTLPIDTGFIVFNDRTYPHFVRLLERLQQPTRESVMTFSVQSAGRGIEYNGASLNALFAQRRNILSPPFYRMVRDILRFNQEAPRLLEGAFDDTRLGEYLNNNGYSPEFGDLYLVPMAAAIWSAQPDRIWDMPVHFLVRFFRNHGLLQLRDRPVWRTIDGGSREYVRKLVDGHRDRIRLSTPVRSLRRIDGGVLVMTDRFEAERFDYVVLACHSDQALHLLADPTPAETDVLSAIEYQENEAILHTDENVLPRRRRCWAAWNYHIPRDIRKHAVVSYNMNILQGFHATQQFCVTLNDTARIAPGKIIRRFSYHHPVFCRESIDAQARQRELNTGMRTFYCGAYWRNGFHEDGVVSALKAVRDFEEALQNEKLHIRRAG